MHKDFNIRKTKSQNLKDLIKLGINIEVFMEDNTTENILSTYMFPLEKT